jgi:oxidase EvaA
MAEMLAAIGNRAALDRASGAHTGAAEEFTASGLTEDQAGALDEWWCDRNQAGRFEVTRIPFAELQSWHFDRASGNLVHDSGKFFSVEGMRVRSRSGTDELTRPVIDQPEIGILGFVVKEFGGVLHFLMQAKMEPGNINVLQLSPTVQATQSNYTRVHRGSNTRYLEYFTRTNRSEVLVDVLQSEHGLWCWRKQNRNMVVKVEGDVPEHEDFRWMTLHRLRKLLQKDNFVNMQARTVLSCMPFARPAMADSEPFAEALLRSYGAGTDAAHPLPEILSWLTDAKARCDWNAWTIPMTQVRGWSRTSDEIVDDENQDMRVIAVRVSAGNREVSHWTQPLLMPLQNRLAAFLIRPINGTMHVLARAVPEPGLAGKVEMAPTVHLPPHKKPYASETEPFLDEVLRATGSRVRFDSVMSEEGGRFSHAQTRYMVVEVGEDFPVRPSDEYCWITVGQVMELLRHGYYVNVEARTLLACIHSLW